MVCISNIMKGGCQTLVGDNMTRSNLRISVFVLLAVMVALSCNKDNGDVLFELKFPPPPIEFVIQPGLGTFDTHVFIQSPIPSYYEARLEDSGRSDDEVTLI